MRVGVKADRRTERQEAQARPFHAGHVLRNEGKSEASAKELEEYLRDNPNVPDADNLRKLIQRLHSAVNNSHAIPNRE